jgi:1-phosphofructokinase
MIIDFSYNRHSNTKEYFMIYTVTLNPSLDYVMHTPTLKTGLTNRSQGEEMYVGGKGINVSLVLKQLNQPTTALGFIAGFTGEAIRNGLEEKNIPTNFVTLSDGLSRINIKLKGQDETEINGCGPVVSEKDFHALLDRFSNLCEKDFLVLSGSIPAGLANDCYTALMQVANNKKAKIILDTAGENLRRSLKEKPFLIKPNRQELEEFFDITIKKEETDKIIQCAKQLQQMGAVNVLVSLGGDGCLLLDENQNIYTMPAPQGTAVNTVGAGDSMIAGFLAGLLTQNDYAYALKLGTACGGATAFSKDLADTATIEQVFSTLADPKHDQ